MKYLVDANVLSEPTRPDPQTGVVDWLRRHERTLAVDPVILGEIRFGILLLPRGKRRSKLEQWFDEGMAEYLTMVIAGRRGVFRQNVMLSYMGQMWGATSRW